VLLLLSPAKSLDFEPLAGNLAQLPHTLPAFPKQTQELIGVLRDLSVQEIAELMHLSDKLASLNVARYLAWRPKFSAKNSKQAVLAFDGDVYTGLDAATLKPNDLLWAQDHLALLSGLYGVLRPLDWMQPYRLEMGTHLQTGKSHNLYGFWGKQIAQHLNKCLTTRNESIVVNLASQEYFKAVDLQTLKARVVECVFEDYKNGQYKIISFFAKQARGLMARYIVQKRLDTPAKLKKFNSAGYAFAPEVSNADRLVFRRKIAAQ